MKGSNLDFCTKYVYTLCSGAHTVYVAHIFVVHAITTHDVVLIGWVNWQTEEMKIRNGI